MPLLGQIISFKTRISLTAPHQHEKARKEGEEKGSEVEGRTHVDRKKGMEPEPARPRILTGDCGRWQTGRQGNSTNLCIWLVNMIRLPLMCSLNQV